MLSQFSSVVRAVQCATEIQRELGAKNEGEPAERRMAFRIGINLGDVIAEDGNLYGEGVNLAARLQTMAEPGGICIAGSVQEKVKNKMTVGFAFLGDQSFKNIGDRIPVFRIDLERQRPASAPGQAATKTGAAQTPGPATVALDRGHASSPAPILS